MMRATGIVRRVNEDGLIPISKAIRDRLNIGEDCCLEFFIDEKEGTIMLKKYEPVSKKTYAQDFFEKFPNASRCGSGQPCVNWCDIYGDSHDSRCIHMNMTCKDCWNRPMEE